MAARGRQSADERLALELATGKTVADAAVAAGVAERTAYRRLADAAFAARVRELRRSVVSVAAARLADGMAGAADVLRKLMDHADPHVRFKAAKAVIELATKVTELSELQQQILEMERSIEENRHDGGRPQIPPTVRVGGDARPDAI